MGSTSARCPSVPISLVPPRSQRGGSLLPPSPGPSRSPHPDAGKSGDPACPEIKIQLEAAEQHTPQLVHAAPGGSQGWGLDREVSPGPGGAGLPGPGHSR